MNRFYSDSPSAESANHAFSLDQASFAAPVSSTHDAPFAARKGFSLLITSKRR